MGAAVCRGAAHLARGASCAATAPPGRPYDEELPLPPVKAFKANESGAES